MHKQPPFPLDPHKISSAFDIIINSNNSKQLIKQADNYIHHCQTNPQFAITLMKIFNQTNNPNTKWQILIHLKNIIQRNWTTKRRINQISLSQDNKKNIKNGLIQLYKTNWQIYYKQFNQIFKFLAKYQFPTNYPTLKNFINIILSTLANYDIQTFIAPKQLLPYLSLVKTIFKQHSNRKLSHTKQLYIEHIIQPVNHSLVIFCKINNALKILQNTQNTQNNNNNNNGGNNIGGIDVKISNRLLECSRKIDKIILYCLQSSVSSMQTQPTIMQIVYQLIIKIQLILTLRCKQLNQQIQLNIYAILQGISKLQAALPFLFTNFLQKYLQLLLSLLINEKFENQKLINCIITSNTKPLITFAYYSTQSQFKQSLQCRKNINTNYYIQQIKCHQILLNIYGGNNSIAFLQKSILEIMNKYKNNIENDQYLFQENNQYHDTASQFITFQLFLILIKNLLMRFKDQFKGFINKMFDHLIQNNYISVTNAVTNNMYQIILLLTKVYDEPNLNLQKVFLLMQICYKNNDYIMFSKLIRNYNPYFNFTTVSKSFQILIQIISKPNINHQIMYQCSVCIKKMLSQHQNQGLPVQKLGLCIVNLLKLMSIYSNIPTHLWSLLQLINQILKLISNQAVIINIQHILQNINYLIENKNNQEIVINALSDLLQNLLDIVTPQICNNNQILEYLYQISINLVGMHICNNKLQSPIILYKLWLSVARSVYVNKCSKNFADKLINALSTMKQKIIQQDPVIFLQLTQQYLLGGFISLTSDNIISISQQILTITNPQHQNRTIMSLFSLYFSYFLTTKTIIPKMLYYAIQKLRQIQNKLSQLTNILRTFIMIIINHHIIQIGASKIFNILNQIYHNNYKLWFWPYLWSLQYLNHKYASKLASIALISSIEILENSNNILLIQIQDNIPLVKILKAASFQVQSISILSAITSYINSYKTILQQDQKYTRSRLSYNNTNNIPRKFKLHVKQQWAEYSLVDLFYQKFWNVLNRIGWNLEVIDQKFDKLASSRIIGLLTRNSNSNNDNDNDNGGNGGNKGISGEEFRENI